MKTQTTIRTRAVYFAAFAAALFAACADFFEPQAYPGLTRSSESFPITLRDVMGPTLDSRDGYALGTRNYVQLIILDREGNLEAWSECRDNGSGKGSLQVPELDGDTEYTFLLLMGHWQRDYGNDTPEGRFAYFEDRPPTLLASGYTQRKPKNTDNGDIAITMYPLAVTASFVSPDAEPVKVDRMLPKPAALPAGNWSARWTMARMSLCQLLYAQGLAEAEADIGKIFPGTAKDDRKGLVWKSENAPDNTELVFSNLGEVAVDLAGYTPTEPNAPRYVNFNMTYKPYGTPRQVLPLSDNPTGRNAFDPWIIRNGVNDKPQNALTKFTNEANWRRGLAENGNGAAAFTAAAGTALFAPTSLSVTRGYTAGEAGERDYIDAAWTVPGDNPAKSYRLFLSEVGSSAVAVRKEFPAGTIKAHILNSDFDPAKDYTVSVIAVNGKDIAPSASRESPSELAYTVETQDDFNHVMAHSKVKKLNLTLKMSSIAGPVPLDRAVTITGGGVPVTILTGGLTITNGADVKLTNAVVDGEVVLTGGSVTLGSNVIVNGGAGNAVTVNDGSLTMQNGAWINGGNAGVVVNSGSVTLGSNVNVNGGVALNGGRLTTAVDNGASVSITGGLTAGGSADVKLTNAVVDGEVVLTGGSVTLGSKVTVNGGAGDAVTVNGGSLTMQNGASINGGNAGVVVNNSGAFDMQGGEISGSANGVQAAGGTVTMGGGEITGCTNGVQAAGGTVTMSGGEISGCANGVQAAGGTVTMSGGEITGCTNGVAVNGGGTFNLRDDGKISGCGSGVAVSGGAFNMEGGVVGVYPNDGSGGNTGSGVVVSGGGTAEMSGGMIWVNGSNGVEMTGGTFNMTGGEIGANGGNGVEMTGGTFTKRGGGTVYGKHETDEQKNSLGSINGKANTYGPNDNYPAGQ